METRNSCTAGYKAIWSKQEGFPRRDYFAALDPRLSDIVDQKMSRTIVSIGDTGRRADRGGRRLDRPAPGTAVAVANVDAHVSVPAATVTEPGRMVMVMGTSHLPHGHGREDGRRGGHVRRRRGRHPARALRLRGRPVRPWATSSPGSWTTSSRRSTTEQAEREGVDVHTVLEREAAKLAPGQSGLVALDWWNGNRSILVDVDLSGLLLGATLATTAPEIYRALIEATAFGTRMIVESFETSGVPVNDLVACGGLPERNRLLMQIYADVTKRRISVAASPQTPALGSAMWAAVAAGAAAGGYDRIEDAAARMARLRDERYEPDAAGARRL